MVDIKARVIIKEDTILTRDIVLLQVKTHIAMGNKDKVPTEEVMAVHMEVLVVIRIQVATQVDIVVEDMVGVTNSKLLSKVTHKDIAINHTEDNSIT